MDEAQRLKEEKKEKRKKIKKEAIVFFPYIFLERNKAASFTVFLPSVLKFPVKASDCP